MEVCARIQSGTLEIDAVVTLSSSNGEAEGRYITCTVMTHALEVEQPIFNIQPQQILSKLQRN